MGASPPMRIRADLDLAGLAGRDHGVGIVGRAPGGPPPGVRAESGEIVPRPLRPLRHRVQAPSLRRHRPGTGRRSASSGIPLARSVARLRRLPTRADPPRSTATSPSGRAPAGWALGAPSAPPGGAGQASLAAGWPRAVYAVRHIPRRSADFEAKILIVGAVPWAPVALSAAKRCDPLSEPVVLIEKGSLGSARRDEPARSFTRVPRAPAGMARDALKVYSGMHSTVGSVGYRKTGVLVVAGSGKEAIEGLAKDVAMQRSPINVQLVGATEIAGWGSRSVTTRWGPTSPTAATSRRARRSRPSRRSRARTRPRGPASTSPGHRGGWTRGRRLHQRGVPGAQRRPRHRALDQGDPAELGVEAPLRVVRSEEHFVEMPTRRREETSQRDDGHADDIETRFRPIPSSRPVAHPVIIDRSNDLLVRCEPRQRRTRLRRVSFEGSWSSGGGLEVGRGRLRGVGASAPPGRMPVYQDMTDLGGQAAWITLTPDEIDRQSGEEIPGLRGRGLHRERLPAGAQHRRGLSRWSEAGRQRDRPGVLLAGPLRLIARTGASDGAPGQRRLSATRGAIGIPAVEERSLGGIAPEVAARVGALTPSAQHDARRRDSSAVAGALVAALSQDLEAGDGSSPGGAGPRRVVERDGARRLGVSAAGVEPTGRSRLEMIAQDQSASRRPTSHLFTGWMSFGLPMSFVSAMPTTGRAIAEACASRSRATGRSFAPRSP